MRLTYNKYRIIYLSFFIISISFIIFSCKKTDSELKVAKGKVIDFTEYPGVVYLYYKTSENEYSWCTGSIISSNTVLTAAHCSVANYTENFVYTDKTTRVDIKITKNNPNFEYNPKVGVNLEKFKNDISILVLPDGTFENYSGKLQLSDVEPKVQNKVRLVGFGCYTELKQNTENTHGYKETTCDFKRQTEKRTGTNTIDIIPFDKSSIKLYGSGDTMDKIGDMTQEASGVGVLSTSGDSGGPLLLEENQTKILGVASYGSKASNDSEYCRLGYTTTESVWDCMYLNSVYVNPVSVYNMAFLQDMVDNYGAVIPGVQIGIRVLEYNGKVKVLYKEESTSFNENIEEHKVIKSLNGSSYNTMDSLKKAWRNLDFYKRSSASWSFE